MDDLEQPRRVMRETGKCAAGLFRKHLRISYARAVKLQDELTEEYETSIQIGEPVSPQRLPQPELQVLPLGGSDGNSDVAQERRVFPMSNGHAFLPPSCASSWSKCAMWPTMNQKFPQETGAAAIEGSAAHWAAWELLANRPLDRGAKAPNGTIITDEMIEAGELLCNAIAWRKTFTSGQEHIEETLPVPYIKDCFGTPDWWAFNPANLHVEIVDYKFGHRFVDEFFNLQGMLYLTAIIEKLMHGQLIAGEWSASFTIVQPHCYYRGEPIRTHTFGYRETQPYLEQLWAMAAASFHPEPTATTNDHCNDCPGRHACSALQKAAYDAAEFSDRRTPLELPPGSAALELVILQRALKRLEARVEGLTEYITASLRAGTPVPYFRLEPGYGRTLWTIPDGQIIAIGKMFNHDLSKITTVTPTQAEKMGVDPNIVKAYSFRPSTAHKLIQTNPTDAARVFGRSKEGN